jgi:putative tryptophan/tyrosine transport system substrate-binding protein
MRRRDFVKAIVGSTAAWPLAARAQQSVLPEIGFMSARSPEDSAYVLASFHNGLKEGGFVDGRNVKIEYRWARGDYDRLPAFAADFVGRKVKVLVATGGDASARAARAATSSIPIVFTIGGDPVKAGLVDSYNRPGGNATGCVVLSNDMEPKRLSLLREIVPGDYRFGALINPNFPPAMDQLSDLENAARKLGRDLFVAKAGNDAELDAAFAALLRERVGGLVVASDPFFDTRRSSIIAFAAKNRLPAIYQFREYAIDGGLISYGPSITDSYRQVGVYAGRILSGVKPTDLPVLEPTKFDFVINLRTARALGLEIPPIISASADEVIE